MRSKLKFEFPWNTRLASQGLIKVESVGISSFRWRGSECHNCWPFDIRSEKDLAKFKNCLKLSVKVNVAVNE